jgi:carbamoyltransferase
MAGGVALNAVANGRLLREGPFEHIWIQPAAGDAGGALGAAFAALHKYFGHPRTQHAGTDTMQAALLGPKFDADAIEADLRAAGAEYELVGDAGPEDLAAEMIADGKIIGWFQGRMEFGPRALGTRSILADARENDMQSRLNQRIKFREGFRPFAPSVLAECATQYFDMEGESPYMTFVAPVTASRRLAAANGNVTGLERVAEVRSEIPAVTHLDYSARVQTVARDENPSFHRLISAFAKRTGCPLVVNTSFNVRGEPIVCTPADAYACFARTAIDALIIGPFIVRRELQSNSSLAAAASAAVGID